MFAFVFYWRISKSAEADAELGAIHKRMVAVSLKHGGVFYLPYRRVGASLVLMSQSPVIVLFDYIPV